VSERDVHAGRAPVVQRVRCWRHRMCGGAQCGLASVPVRAYADIRCCAHTHRYHADSKCTCGRRGGRRDTSNSVTSSSTMLTYSSNPRSVPTNSLSPFRMIQIFDPASRPHPGGPSWISRRARACVQRRAALAASASPLSRKLPPTDIHVCGGSPTAVGHNSGRAPTSRADTRHKIRCRGPPGPQAPMPRAHYVRARVRRVSRGGHRGGRRGECTDAAIDELERQQLPPHGLRHGVNVRAARPRSPSFAAPR